MKTIPFTFNVNYKLIPVNILPVTDEGAIEFNKLVENCRNGDFSPIVRTESGGISLKAKDFLPPIYDVRALRSCVELTVIDEVMYRVQFRSDAELKSGTGISGAKAFEVFKNICLKHGVNIFDYAIKNGAEVKETIPKPLIHLDSQFVNFPFKKHAHHIDIHSSYMASIAEAYPALRAPIEEVYYGRSTPGKNLINKAILTHTFGYCQSKMLNYSLANLSKAAIEGTIAKLKDLASRVEDTGAAIIAFNTDGFWYYGDKYHGVGEGDGLGQWHNDHDADLLIFKDGVGTYGYIENGKFTPVVRGRRALDKVKPRETWTIEDLDNLGETLKYGWNGERIVKLEG